MSTTILDQLARSPKLGLYYERIRDILEQEKAKREEFYRTVKEGDKAEFINGQMIYHSPVKARHLDASQRLFNLLYNFVERRELGIVYYEKAMVSLTRNDYEPDICFWRSDQAAQFVPTQMKFPAPDLVVEVLSPSTEENDRVTKFEDYAAHGVGEYWLVDPDTETVEQYVLRAETYTLMTKARSGTVASVAVLGFEIPIRAIFDPAENLAALQRMMR